MDTATRLLAGTTYAGWVKCLQYAGGSRLGYRSEWRNDSPGRLASVVLGHLSTGVLFGAEVCEFLSVPRTRPRPQFQCVCLPPSAPQSLLRALCSVPLPKRSTRRYVISDVSTLCPHTPQHSPTTQYHRLKQARSLVRSSNFALHDHLVASSVTVTLISTSHGGSNAAGLSVPPTRQSGFC